MRKKSLLTEFNRCKVDQTFLTENSNNTIGNKTVYLETYISSVEVMQRIESNIETYYLHQYSNTWIATDTNSKKPLIELTNENLKAKLKPLIDGLEESNNVERKLKKMNNIKKGYYLYNKL